MTPHILEGSCRQYRTTQPDLINKLDWSAFKVKKGAKGKGSKDGSGKSGQKDSNEKNKDKKLNQTKDK